MKCQKVHEQKSVYQLTMRDVSFFSVIEQNIIEIYSSNNIELTKTIKNQLFGLSASYSEIYEIGRKQLFKGSKFSDSSMFNPSSTKYYLLLNELLEQDVQLLIVQSDTFLKNHEQQVLSDIAATGTKLRMIIFLTHSDRPKILPVLNFVQINSLPIVDVLNYRNSFEQNYELLDRMYQSLIFNYMI